MWICPKCEAANEGEVCIVCGTQKPRYNHQQNYDQQSNNQQGYGYAQPQGYNQPIYNRESTYVAPPPPAPKSDFKILLLIIPMILIIIGAIVAFVIFNSQAKKDMETKLAQINRQLIDEREAQANTKAMIPTDDKQNVGSNNSSASQSSSSDATKVKNYVAQNKTLLESDFASIFHEDSGMNCDVSIEADGTGIVYYIFLDRIDGVDAATKKSLQKTYDGMQSTFDNSFSRLQVDVPELTFLKMLLCEEDGDIIATAIAEN